MSVLRPLDKQPGLNTATILVGVSRSASPACLSLSAAPPLLAPLGSLRFWRALFGPGRGGRESHTLNQSEQPPSEAGGRIHQ
ncbi:hypothetical protein VULLAG_LOCUS6380 [Vulpes lagopus]